MRKPIEGGFSLVELAITLVVLGILFAFSLPAFRGITATQLLRASTENVAAQLRLAREKAIATGAEQPIHILSATVYHVHYTYGIATTWTLPRGIRFASTSQNTWYRMQPTGRCTNSGLVVLTDARGYRDTVSVQLSGLVLTR